MAWGAPDPRPRFDDKLGGRLIDVGIYFFGQKKVAEEGPLHRTSKHHLFIFWGFLVITIATVDIIVSGVVPGAVAAPPARRALQPAVLRDRRDEPRRAAHDPVGGGAAHAGASRQAHPDGASTPGSSSAPSAALMVTHFLYHGYRTARSRLAAGEPLVAGTVDVERGGRLARPAAAADARQPRRDAGLLAATSLIVSPSSTTCPTPSTSTCWARCPTSSRATGPSAGSTCPRSTSRTRPSGASASSSSSRGRACSTPTPAPSARAAATTARPTPPARTCRRCSWCTTSATRCSTASRAATRSPGSSARRRRWLESTRRARPRRRPTRHPDLVATRQALAVARTAEADMPRLTGGRIAEDTCGRAPPAAPARRCARCSSSTR
jgi:hypothetical protein